MRKIQIVLLASGALALGLAAFLLKQQAADVVQPGFAALTVLPAGRALEDFELLDHRGASFGKADFSGHWSVLFFGFTHCPDVCPTTLYDLARLRRQLTDLPAGQLPAVYMVSVDVERDTPEVMARYVAAFNESFTGLTGEATELARLAGPLGVAYDTVPGEGDDYEVLHSAALFLLDEQGKFVAVASAPHDVDALARDYRVLVSRERA